MTGTLRVGSKRWKKVTEMNLCVTEARIGFWQSFARVTTIDWRYVNQLQTNKQMDCLLHVEQQLLIKGYLTVESQGSFCLAIKQSPVHSDALNCTLSHSYSDIFTLTSHGVCIPWGSVGSQSAHWLWVFQLSVSMPNIVVVFHDTMSVAYNSVEMVSQFRHQVALHVIPILWIIFFDIPLDMKDHVILDGYVSTVMHFQLGIHP